jgi:hypothetical protein
VKPTGHSTSGGKAKKRVGFGKPWTKPANAEDVQAFYESYVLHKEAAAIAMAAQQKRAKMKKVPTEEFNKLSLEAEQCF